MTKRSVRNFDKTITQTFKAMRDSVVKLGLEFEKVEKDRYIIEMKTKTSYIFFGGQKYTMAARSITEKSTQVTITAKSDVSQNNLNELSESIFANMDRELPIAAS